MGSLVHYYYSPLKNVKCKQAFTFSQLLSLFLMLQNLLQILMIRDKVLKLEVKGRQVKHGGHLEKWKRVERCSIKRFLCILKCSAQISRITPDSVGLYSSLCGHRNTDNKQQCSRLDGKLTTYFTTRTNHHLTVIGSSGYCSPALKF